MPMRQAPHRHGHQQKKLPPPPPLPPPPLVTSPTPPKFCCVPQVAFVLIRLVLRGATASKLLYAGFALTGLLYAACYKSIASSLGALLLVLPVCCRYCAASMLQAASGPWSRQPSI